MKAKININTVRDQLEKIKARECSHYDFETQRDSQCFNWLLHNGYISYGCRAAYNDSLDVEVSLLPKGDQLLMNIYQIEAIKI